MDEMNEINEMRKTDCEFCADLKFISLEKLYNYRRYHCHFFLPDGCNKYYEKISYLYEQNL